MKEEAKRDLDKGGAKRATSREGVSVGNELFLSKELLRFQVST